MTSLHEQGVNGGGEVAGTSKNKLGVVVEWQYL